MYHNFFIVEFIFHHHINNLEQSKKKSVLNSSGKKRLQATMFNNFTKRTKWKIAEVHLTLAWIIIGVNDNELTRIPQFYGKFKVMT